MKQCKGFIDGVATLAFVGQAFFLALFVFGEAGGADLPYAFIMAAEFACFGFGLGWSCRR